MTDMKPEISRKLRYFLAEIFVIDFILLVGGWTLLHFNCEYVGYQQAADSMLIAALIISFIISAIACVWLTAITYRQVSMDWDILLHARHHYSETNPPLHSWPYRCESMEMYL